MTRAENLIVGLGNPGPTYAHNRHNLGFRVVEELARRLGAAFGVVGSLYAAAEVSAPDASLVLLKPLTYMNRSGQAIAAWSRDTGMAVTGELPGRPEEGDQDGVGGETVPPCLDTRLRPLVVCDDLNLPLGSLRLRPRGSAGGQNGLISVIDHLGGEDFPRLRLGIAPLDREIDPADWPDHVLADFEPAEQELAADLVDHAASALEYWLQEGLEPTVSKFNRRIRPAGDPSD